MILYVYNYREPKFSLIFQVRFVDNEVVTISDILVLDRRTKKSIKTNTLKKIPFKGNKYSIELHNNKLISQIIIKYKFFKI